MSSVGAKTVPDDIAAEAEVRQGINLGKPGRETMKIETNHRRLVFVCCVLCALVVAVGSCSRDTQKDLTAEAVTAAESWLGMVDRGEYGMSWDQSADLFRSAVSKAGWEQSLDSAREPLGELVSRSVKSAEYATTLPGAPDGEYVVIQFTTVFSNRESAVETVTPMKDPDGAWRVSGYYIK